MDHFVEVRGRFLFHLTTGDFNKEHYYWKSFPNVDEVLFLEWIHYCTFKSC